MFLAIAVTAVICLAAGFGLGRIKNSAKLQAIDKEIGNVTSYVTSETRELIDRIRKHI